MKLKVEVGGKDQTALSTPRVVPPSSPTALLVSPALASVPEGACLDVGQVMGGGERDLTAADGGVI